MILFKENFIVKIWTGQKTQTRRLWYNLRAKPGTLHFAQTSLKPESKFARLEIIDGREWDGETISLRDVTSEGFEKVEDFWTTIEALNENRIKDEGRKWYTVEFKCIELPKYPHDVWGKITHEQWREMRGIK